jgi:V/A-type H+/Na+-transporting ATPase subunit G/H
MRIEVLKSIKQSEEAYKTMIAEARAEKERRINAARLEADNMVIRAAADVEEYKKKRLADAHAEAAIKRRAIMKEGEERVNALRAKGKKNQEKAVAFLTTRFKEQL